MKHFNSIALAVLIGIALLAGHARATPATEPDGWSLGAIVALGTNPYIGEDTQIEPYPLITYRSGPFSIGTLGLTYDLYHTDQWLLTTGITPRFSGLFNTDAPELEGIDRDVTADLFFKASYQVNSSVDTSLRLRQEITGDHDGQELTVDLGYSTRLDTTDLRLSAGASWQSAELGTYIWGVRPFEARAGRPSYDTGDVIIPFLAVEAERPITDRWALIGNLRADLLPNDVTDSPIVDEDTLIVIGLGAVYRF